jgi:hypothetical protein
MPDRAEVIVDLLYDDDAWLCSIPHGQYETYVPHRKEDAVRKVREALGKTERQERKR